MTRHLVQLEGGKKGGGGSNITLLHTNMVLTIWFLGWSWNNFWFLDIVRIISDLVLDVVGIISHLDLCEILV